MKIAQIAPAVPLEFLKEIKAINPLNCPPLIMKKLKLTGGGGVYPLELSKKIAKRGFSVNLITPAPHAGVYDVDDLLRTTLVKAIYFYPFSPSNPLPMFSPRILKPLDIIHIHQFNKTLSNVAAVYSKLLKKPVFVTDHGGGGLALDYSKLVNGFLTVSEYSAGMFKPYKERVRIVYAGVDLSKIKSRSEAEKLRLELLRDAEGVILLYVGVLHRRKKIEDLIAAFSSLKRSYHRLKLVICGGELQTGYYDYLRDIVSSNFREDIIFTGYVKEEDKFLYYAASDILILPSSHELLGLVLLEAMASRMPVVASNIGGTLEVVVNGQTGFLVEAREWRKYLKPGVVSVKELAEKIRFLIEDEELRKSMGEAGRKRVEKHFTWDKVAERVLTAYSELH